jgi:hypothetical protein
MKPLGISSTYFKAIQRIFCNCQVLRKKLEYNETVHQLFMDLKKSYDSVRRGELHNILIEFDNP